MVLAGLYFTLVWCFTGNASGILDALFDQGRCYIPSESGRKLDYRLARLDNRRILPILNICTWADLKRGRRTRSTVLVIAGSNGYRQHMSSHETPYSRCR